MRSSNFGQHWRTEGVVEVSYRVELPRSFVFDVLREQLPDYIDDSRDHFDPESEIDRALEAAGWPTADEVLERRIRLDDFVAFYMHQLLLDWFGDVEPEQQPGFVLNTIDAIESADDADIVAVRGMARRTGHAVRYQDR